MSPEQASLTDQAIDTRSDVYALGALLYELITGDTPFGRMTTRPAPILDFFRLLREQEPAPPSSRLTVADTVVDVAAHRATEPGRLLRKVRGELDWIVLKCLEKAPARRYETATALAEEVRRYLNQEPVLAGPPSKMYRLRKWIQRNRAVTAAACLFLLALVAGIIGTTLGMIRADREGATARGERDQRKAALAIVEGEQAITRQALISESQARERAMAARATTSC
jgi:non-specific serine/threonine protein kinase/serine/threonine-protein kinase